MQKKKNHHNFLEKIEKFNSNICFVDENEKKTLYKDIIRKSKILTKRLKPRALIFVLISNHVESLTGYIGFLRKGLVQMLLDMAVPEFFDLMFGL